MMQENYCDREIYFVCYNVLFIKVFYLLDYGFIIKFNKILLDIGW